MRRGETLSEGCLLCHGNPKEAPADLIQIYGSARSFGKKVGDIASVISIRIPMAVAYGKTNSFSLKLSGTLLALLLGMSMAQWWLVRRTLLYPLQTIRDKALRIASHDVHLGEKIPLPSQKELRELTSAFNAMSGSLKVGRDHLEEQVARRTAELERDNAKRKRVEIALLASEEKFATAFRSSPGAITINRQSDFHFIEVNDRFLTLTGYERHEVLGRTAAEMMLWYDPKLMEKLFEVLPDGMGLNDFEFSYRHKCGQRRTGLMSAEFIELEGESCVLAATFDITRRKEAEKALKISEGRFRQVVESTPDILYCASPPDFGATFINPAIETWLGFTPRNWLSDPGLWARQIHERDLPRVMAARGKAYLTEEDLAPEYRMWHKDGKTLRWFEDRVSFERDYRGAILSANGAMSEISVRKKTEEALSCYQDQLRSLSAEISLIEERERRHIATELHDNLGQTLALANIKLDILKSSLSPGENKEIYQEVKKLIENTIDYTRSLTFEVSPPILYNFSIDASVEWLSEQILEEYGIERQIEVYSNDLPMAEDSSVLLFKIVKEIMVNIVKHARARKVKISVGRENDNVFVEITDDGKGFKQAQKNPATKEVPGFGLFSINERITYLGGEFEISSQPNEGTHIRLVVPLKGKNL